MTSYEEWERIRERNRWIDSRFTDLDRRNIRGEERQEEMKKILVEADIKFPKI